MHVCSKCRTIAPPDALLCPEDQGELIAVEGLPSGALLDGYRVIRCLGVGGMGSVYEAEHISLGRRSALKVLLPKFSQNRAILERFLAEARSVNLIRHENIVNIYDFSTTPAGDFYFVMEFLDGEDFEHFLQKNAPLSEEVLFPIFLQISRALAAVHEKGIVHRDLKPANIFLVPRENTHFVKLLDFGLATLQGEQGAGEGEPLWGTPYYMAPEYIRRKTFSPLSDQYAFGVMLYRAVTGQRPFEGKDSQEIFRKHLQESPVDPRKLNPALSEALSALVLRTLAKEPEARFPGMRALTQELQALFDARPRSAAGAVLSPLRAGQSRRSFWARGVALGGVALALGSLGVWALSPKAPSSAPSKPSLYLQAEEGEVGPLLERARVAVLRALEQGASERVEAVRTMREISLSGTSALLLPLLKDPDLEVRREVVLALGALGDKESIPALKELLTSSGPRLGLDISAALFRLGDASSERALIKALSDPTQRIGAAVVLAEAGRGEGLSVLKEALGEGLLSPELAVSVARALLSLEDEQGREFLGKTSLGEGALAARAALALAETGEEEHLSRLHARAEQDIFFAEALARLGDPRALPVILGFLQGPEPPGRIVSRALAIYAARATLSQEGRKSAVALLEEQDELIRLSAALAVMASYTAGEQGATERRR